MTVVVRSFVVSATPAAALGYLRDFGNTVEWDPGTRQTTRTGSGPIVVGTTWHNVSKVLGVTTELTYCLTEVTGDRLVFVGRNEGATSTDTITVRPAPDDGTEVTYHVHLELHGLAKLATPVMKLEFEKLGNEVAARLTEVLNRLSEPRSTMH